MKYTINITDTAKAQLQDVAIYIAEQSNEKEVAKNFVNEIVDKCFTLAEYPNRGANPEDRVLASMGYKFILHKEYLIFYTVDDFDCTVYIQAVFNAKKDYTKFFKKFVLTTKQA